MAQHECGLRDSNKWYKKNIFPLIPIIETREEDKYNTSHFSFRWLFITIWSIDSFCFEISIVADTHWGIGVVGLFPYFRWVLTIPCPEKFGMWIQKHLCRSPKNNENNEI
jgi:hypothetical protein